MNYKPVVLIYDLNNKLVDEIAGLIGTTGQYTTINTFNETNAMEAIRQYDRGFGVLTNRLSCILTGWNSHKKRRDQFLFRLRDKERQSPFRRPTPVVVITEDHMTELKRIALDPTDGDVSAYLDTEDFSHNLLDLLEKIVFRNQSRELNSVAFANIQRLRD
ncbi:MAG: hypothetical protein WDZ76_05895 [Pseudohongiellaceae bacterium]